MALKDLLKGIIKTKGDKSAPEAEQPSVLINGFPALQSMAPSGDKNAGGMAGHPILGGGGDPPPSHAPLSSPGTTEEAMNFISTGPPAQQPPHALNETSESPHPMSPGGQELPPPPLPTEPTASGMDWLSLGTTVTSTTPTATPEASGEAPGETSITLPPPLPPPSLDPAEPTMNLSEFINPPLSPEDPSGMFPSGPPPQEALASPALNLAEANLEQQAQDLLAHFNPAPQAEMAPPTEETSEAVPETAPEASMDLQAANDLLSQFTQKKAAPPSLTDTTEEPPFELPASSEPLAQAEDLFSAFTQQAQPEALGITHEPAAAEAKSFSPEPGNAMPENLNIENLNMDEFLSQSLATPDPALLKTLETDFQLPEVDDPLQAAPTRASSETDLLNDFLSGVTPPVSSTAETEPTPPQEPSPTMDLAAFNDLVTPQNLQQEPPGPEPTQAAAPDSTLTAMLDQVSLLNESLLPAPAPKEPKLESPLQEPPKEIELPEVAALDTVQAEALLNNPLPEPIQEATASAPPAESSEIEAFMSFLDTPAPTDTMAEIPETLLAEPSLDAVEAHVRENILHEPPAPQAKREPQRTKQEHSAPPQASKREKAPPKPKAEPTPQATTPSKPAQKPKPPSQFPGESMAFGPSQKADKAKQRPAQYKAPPATGKATELLEASHVVNEDINALVNGYFAEKKAELLAMD